MAQHTFRGFEPGETVELREPSTPGGSVCSEVLFTDREAADLYAVKESGVADAIGSVTLTRTDPPSGPVRYVPCSATGRTSGRRVVML